MKEQMLALDRLRIRVGRETWLAVLWVAAGVALFGLTLLASLRIAPSIDNQGRDNAIYATIGQVILEGGVPYRDAWDNKTPGAYYLDALFLGVFGVSQWALWIGELLTIFVAALVMSRLLRHMTRRRLVAAVGSAVFVLLARHPGFASGGNFTESYALLPQVLCLALGYAFLVRPGLRNGFAVGLAASLVFLVKQTSVGVVFAFLPALLLSGHPVIRAPRRAAWLAAIVAGGLTGIGVVAAYLALHGVLGLALDAALVHPIAYHTWASEESSSLWRAVLGTLTQSQVIPALGPLLPLWAVAVADVARRRHAASPPNSRESAAAALTVWALVTLLIDLVLVNITGREYRHYYITLAASASLLAAAGVAVIVRTGTLWPGSRRRGAVWVAGAVVYALAVSAAQPAVVTLGELSRAGWDVRGPARETWLSRYVIQHTEPDDQVLVWGARAQVNFQSGRMSPTRYHYSYPLIIEGYTSEERVRDMVDELKASPPALIVDTALIDGPWVPPLDPSVRALWRDANGRPAIAALEPFFAYVNDACHVQDILGQVMVYRCAGHDPAGHLSGPSPGTQGATGQPAD